MLLSELIKNIPVLESVGNLAQQVGRIRFDSRLVTPGDVFVALRGVSADGHAFLDSALKNGAAAVVVEHLPIALPTHVALIRVADSAAALGHLAANYYGNPSTQMTVVGVTGTNGKTTTTTLMWQLFSALGYTCGLIGTVENRIGQQTLASTHTTPDAISLQALLREMADAGCSHVFMEVSSHAVHQRRISGIRFAGAVFTNLTHDHLDYHKTFANYRDAKKMFFDELPDAAFALTNVDDRNGNIMLQNTQARKWTYGLKKPADFKAKMLDNSLDGLLLELDGAQIHTRVIGAFNAYNLTAAYAVARLLEVEKMACLAALSNVPGAEGRFERLQHPAKPGCIGVVDYAHTPDALEKVLETIVQLKRKSSRIITVTGAGGDRDKTKRPLMAQVCARYSDQLILTSDNPRTEDPAAILSDMEAGLDDAGIRKTLVVPDRAQAIKTAVKLAAENDVILVAGKGHEKYQEIQGVKHPFDDKKVLFEMMQNL